METCEICDQPCMTGMGRFDLPIKDVVSGAPIGGMCCGVCGPKVQAFAEGKCQDINLLPDGPLKSYLGRQNQLYQGLFALDIIGWLAQHYATVRFFNREMVAGGPPNGVEVTATLDDFTTVTLEGDKLDAVVNQLAALNVERKEGGGSGQDGGA